MRRAGLVVLLVGLGCSGITTSADYDPAADFSRMKSWAWFEGGPPQPKLDSLTDGRIRSSVEGELGARGLPKTEAAKADFLVQYHAAVQRKVEARPTTVSVGYGWRYGAIGMSSSEIHTYDEGTLVVDFIDPQKKELVWRGTARAAVDPSRTPEEKSARIREAVQRILEQFPPKR